MDLAFNAVAWRLGKKSDQQKKVATKDAGILNCCTLFSYAFWRVGSAFGDGTIGAVTLLYTEDFGMSMSTIAMLRAASKCLDFGVGFVIAWWSDNMQSRFGRRKPFIVVGATVGAAGAYMLGTPPASFAAPKPKPVGIGENALCYAAVRRPPPPLPA